MKSKKQNFTALLNRALIALGITVISNSLNAQQLTVDNIKVFEGAGEIENLGYYAFYQADGERGKMRNYTLKFYDFDYNLIGDEKVELSKRATLVDSESNKTHVAIAVGDTKLKQLSIRSFDKSGNLEGELDFPDQKFPTADLYETANGFIIVNQKSTGFGGSKTEYEIFAVDNQLNILWEKEFDEDQNVTEIVDVYSQDESTVVVYSTGKGMNKERYQQNLMRISENGEVLFSKVFANNFYYFPNKILIKNDLTFIFGSFPKDEKSRPGGVFAIGFDSKGEIVMNNEIDYKERISPEIEDLISEDDINVKEDPQFIVNDVIVDGDDFYLITESIRIRPALGGGVEVYSSGGASGSLQINTAFFMGDFLILKLDKDLKLQNVKVITKNPNKIVVEGVVFNVNQYYPIMKQRSSNMSNYQFFVRKDDGTPMIVYTIRKSYRSNINVGVVDITTDEKVTKSNPVTSELEKLKDLGVFGVMRNKPGSLAVLIYKRGEMAFYELAY